MTRLSAARLDHLRGAETPRYDRTADATVVHLGVGAFARAHLCVYADDLLRRGHDATVHGVSLRSDHARADLAPQDGLFTVLEREPQRRPAPRVVGSLTAVGTGAADAVAAIARPGARMVTMTVTEKGYEVPTDGWESSVVGVLVAGLDARRRAHLAAPVVASLDNVADNGDVLRRASLAVAARYEPGLAAWIREEVRFPRSVVDRMVPATSAADRAEVAALLGVEDRAVVVAEAHRSWAIDRVDGLLPLDEVGVEVVGDVAPHQVRKLWLLNGPHSALAYVGPWFDCETIAQAADHPIVGRFVGRFVDDVLEVAPHDAATRAFAADSLRRFRNPALGHTCAQVGADGSRKLPQRLWPVVAARRAQGLATRRAAAVVAAWLCRIDHLRDPDHERLLRATTDRDRADLALVGTDPGFRDEVVAMMGRLRDRGPAVFEEDR